MVQCFKQDLWDIIPTQDLEDKKELMLPLFKDMYWKIPKTNYKRYSFNVFPSILADGIINNITKNFLYYENIGPTILELFREENYKPLHVFDKSIIKFGTRKNVIWFCNKDLVNSRSI